MEFKKKRSSQSLLRAAVVLLLFFGVPVWLFVWAAITRSTGSWLCLLGWCYASNVLCGRAEEWMM